MKGTAFVIASVALGAMVVVRASHSEPNRPVPSLDEHISQAIEVDQPGARVYWRIDRLEVHKSATRRTYDAKPASHLIISAPDVTVFLDASLILDGTAATEPAISAKAEATGLRIVGNRSGAMPIIRGYAGAIYGPAADRVTVSRVSIDRCYGPGIVLGDDAIVDDVRVYRASGNGVELGRLSSAERVVVHNARGRGISLGERSHVGWSDVSGHASEGILVGAGGTVVESRSSNGKAGIVLGRGSLARSVVVVSNVDDGIIASYSCLVTSSVAEMNGGNGIVVDDGSIVESSVANDNGNAGVVSGKGCVLRGLTARTNVHAGFLVGAGSRLIDSTASNGFVGVRTLSSAVVLDGVTSHGNAYGISAPTPIESGTTFSRNTQGVYLPAGSE